MSQQTQIIPWSFIETTLPLTNYGSNAIAYTTDKIPDGFIGKIRDANIIFTTAGGGVSFQKLSKGGKTTRFTPEFTSDTTGLNELVTGGDKIQVVVTTTGVGVIDLVWHGELIPVLSGKELRRSKTVSLFEGDGV